VARLEQLRREMAVLDESRGQPDLLELGDLDTQVTPGIWRGWACKGISYPSGQRHFIAVIHLSTCIVLFYRWPLHHRSGALQLASPSRSPLLQPKWPPPAAAQAASPGLSVQQVGSMGLVSQRLKIERTATDAQGAAPTHQVASHISCRSLPPTWTSQA